MSRRSGATLIEVLVAIFVMAIGMLALLTLFPIGVLTMRQAIQDDRTAHASASATTIAKMLFSTSKYDAWFKKADQDIPPPALVDALVEGPSYALYLDGVGTLSYLPPYSNWIAGQSNGIRRLVFPDPTSPSGAPINSPFLWQVSPDDIVFDKNGIPAQITGGVFERNSTYSWAYLVRRPMYGKPNVVDLTIVVYNDRPLVMNSSLQAGETLFDSQFNPTANIVTVSWNPALGEAPPAVRVGGWIMDTTPVMAGAGPPAVYGPSHARFYRVVSITQTSGTTVDLEVQSPIKDFPLPAPTPAASAYNGKIAVLDGIAEVFEKGPVQFQIP